MSGCKHDWWETRAWTDEKGVRHIERKCLKCKELTELVSAIDVHELRAVDQSADVRDK